MAVKILIMVLYAIIPCRLVGGYQGLVVINRLHFQGGSSYAPTGLHGVIFEKTPQCRFIS
jgi:hypothetical protein